MFDLFRSREKSVRYLLGALLGLVAVSMVITLIPGYGSGAAANNNVVAEVGGEPITLQEVQLGLRTAQRNKQIPPGLEEFYVPQLIDGLVNDRAISYEAQRLGFEVSETDLANTIRSILPPQLFQDGKLISKDTYAGFLAQNGTSIAEFERNVRKQMLLLRLRNMVAEGVIVTPQEVEAAYKKRNEKVKIAYATISPNKLRETIKPTPAELQAYYQKSLAAFQLPERRSFELVTIDQTKLQQSATVTDAQLQQLYSGSKESYRTPERVHARHILVKTSPDQSKEIQDKAKAKAEDLVKQLRAGGDFAALALKNSEDPGSGAKGGDLGFFEHGQMVPEFDKAAFSQKVKEIGDPIKSQFGYHIIQVMEHEDARLKPFEEVRPQIEADAKNRAALDKIQSVTEQARTALAKNPSAAAQVAAQLGLTATTMNQAVMGGTYPLVGSSRELDTAVFGLKKGEVSQPITISPSQNGIAVLTDIQPPRQAKFEEVQQQVETRYINEKVNDVVQAKAKELAAKAKAAGGDLQKAAKEVGAEYKSVPEFGRDGAAEGLGAASTLGQVFDAKAGEIVGPITVPDQVVVAKLEQKIPADLSKLATLRQQLLDALKQQKARERNELFESGLVTRLIKEGKVKMNQDVIKRVSTALRG